MARRAAAEVTGGLSVAALGCCRCSQGASGRRRAQGSHNGQREQVQKAGNVQHPAANPPPMLFSLCRSVRYETLIGKEGVRREEKEGEGREQNSN